MLNILKLVTKKVYPDADPNTIPVVAKALFKDSGFLVDLEDSLEKRDLCGNDYIGGIAYVGKKETITKLEMQVQNYLKIVKDKSQSENMPFYMLWHIEDMAMLILYEDYYRETKTPTYPDVLKMYFGAYAGDANLVSLFTESDELDDLPQAGMLWLGDNVFDPTDTSHQQLLDETKKIVLTLFNS